MELELEDPFREVGFICATSHGYCSRHIVKQGTGAKAPDLTPRSARLHHTPAQTLEHRP